MFGNHHKNHGSVSNPREVRPQRPSLQRKPFVEILEARTLMTVFGPDNRSWVRNTRAMPFAYVAHVDVTFPNGQSFTGTAAMVGSKHVLTAAHMVYSRENGGWARSITVSPGQSGSSRPFGSAKGTQMRTWNGWVKNESFSDDMALVTLNKSIGSNTGWFGMMGNGVGAGTTVNTAGYPGDKGGNHMYFTYGRTSKVGDGQIFYRDQMDAMGGQSGSPVWKLQSGRRYLVGVHSWGSPQYNGACLLTTSKLNTILSWMKQDRGARKASSFADGTSQLPKTVQVHGGSAQGWPRATIVAAIGAGPAQPKSAVAAPLSAPPMEHAPIGSGKLSSSAAKKVAPLVAAAGAPTESAKNHAAVDLVFADLELFAAT